MLSKKKKKIRKLRENSKTCSIGDAKVVHASTFKTKRLSNLLTCDGRMIDVFRSNIFMFQNNVMFLIFSMFQKMRTVFLKIVTVRKNFGKRGVYFFFEKIEAFVKTFDANKRGKKQQEGRSLLKKVNPNM